MAITVPYIFTNATAAEASEVNANFAAIIAKALDKTGDTMSGTLTIGTLAITASLDVSATTAVKLVGSQATNDLFRAASATTVARIAGAASSVLVTDGSSVPSLSQTLPTAVQDNITRLGTVTSGVWNAGTVTAASLVGTLTGGCSGNAGTATKLATARAINGVNFDGTADITVTAETIPSGAVWMFAGAAAPTGWLLCDGSAISRTDYSGLFTAIGTTFGVGNGTTTFNIPNYQDRMPIGKSATLALGATGGAFDHTHTGPSHTHGAGTLAGPAHTHTGPAHTHDSGTLATSAHTHTVDNHTHAAGTLAGPGHTHTGPSHTHDAGTLSGPSHWHVVDSHTHTGPSHEHTYTTVIAHTHVATLIDHTHGVRTSDGTGASTVSVADGAASGSLDRASGGVWDGGTGPYTMTTTSTGSASGTTSAAGTGATGAATPNTNSAGTGTVGGSTGASGTGYTSSDGTGAVTGSTAASGSQTSSAASVTTLSGATASAGTGATGSSGTAAVTGATAADGTGASGTNNPPYLTVNFIIKT